MNMKKDHHKDNKKLNKSGPDHEKNFEAKKEPKIRNFVLGKKRAEKKGGDSNRTESGKKSLGVAAHKSERFPKKENPSKRTRREKPTYDLKKDQGKKEIDPGRKEDNLIRLNRYIANAGVCSRRDADLLIQAGEIKVNGKVVTEMGHKVDRFATVKYKNRVLSREKPVYILLNKPKNFITTTDDPKERKTIMQLVANACEERIYPVGRLDRNTTGLIVLTNDGDLAKKLSHPSHQVKKLYQVDLDKPLSDEDFLKIQEGISLEDGLAKVDEIAFVTPDKTSIGIELHIGKNRIVRRIFEHLGYEVVKLDRVMYAGLDKKDLSRGDWRFLSEKEVMRLKQIKPGAASGKK